MFAKSFWLAMATLALSCGPVAAKLAELGPPSKPFAEMTPPPAPNYSDRATWVVWPGVPSAADVVPKGIKGGVAVKPAADVFFIHPTTYLKNATWNARFDEDGETRDVLEAGVLRFQLSAFNGCCRMFAPRYRQTTISAFLKPSADSFSAYDLAYSDVLRAFDYYIANENKGRPFILASHSQGSLHATRLMQDRIIARPELRKSLVAAYVVGASMPERQEYTGLPVCNSARQTGCIVDWNSTTALTPLALGRGLMVTYAEGKYQAVGLKRWLCVNPLSWDRTTVTPASANRGAIPAVASDQALKPLVAGVTGARCSRGRLVVQIPSSKRAGFQDVLTKLGSYHNLDYNLFYASIRRNAIQRVDTFMRK